VEIAATRGFRRESYTLVVAVPPRIVALIAVISVIPRLVPLIIVISISFRLIIPIAQITVLLGPTGFA
jgi:hypothetical protein